MANNEGTVALNNYLQSIGQATSLVWSDSCQGPAHSPEWTSVCKINGEAMGKGTGPQKHVARDMAAKAALKVLKGET